MKRNLDKFMQKAVQLNSKIERLRHRESHLAHPQDERAWQPQMDLYGFESHLFADIELPGVPPALVEVKMEGGRLIRVTGRKAPPENFHQREIMAQGRSFGPFELHFIIPGGKIAAGLEQRLENGVLHLKIGLQAAPK